MRKNDAFVAKIVITRLTKGFMAMFAPAESLPSPATLHFFRESPKNRCGVKECQQFTGNLVSYLLFKELTHSHILALGNQWKSIGLLQHCNIVIVFRKKRLDLIHPNPFPAFISFFPSFLSPFLSSLPSFLSFFFSFPSSFFSFCFSTFFSFSFTASSALNFLPIA